MNPFLPNAPENIKKHLVLQCFERDRKGTFGNIKVKTSH